MPYATAKDGIRLYYKDWGSGHPVVLIHGWPLSGDTFDDAAVALADKGFRAILPDRRGFGRPTSRGRHDYTLSPTTRRRILEAA